ncbi:hypothetical protein ROA7023_03772 [Roseisalinus antarcticus]|uniref:Uncharacterized protein n=1 Tax=Roseisalinus antarcticus TaxID=254357 RepID=A0A1Y5U1J8_9RHOB|nr:hypothetical protein ROA7023_03772 [Roseisalinus antarcticus]
MSDKAPFALSRFSAKTELTILMTVGKLALVLKLAAAPPVLPATVTFASVAEAKPTWNALPPYAELPVKVVLASVSSPRE